MVQPRPRVDGGRALPPRLPERPDEIRTVLQGRLTYAVGWELRDTLAVLASRRPRRLVLDLRTVSFLDASTVTSLRALERRLAGAGGRLVVEADGAVARTLRHLGAGHLIEPGPPGEALGARLSGRLQGSAPARA